MIPRILDGCETQKPFSEKPRREEGEDGEQNRQAHSGLGRRLLVSARENLNSANPQNLPKNDDPPSTPHIVVATETSFFLGDISGNKGPLGSHKQPSQVLKVV